MAKVRVTHAGVLCLLAYALSQMVASAAEMPKLHLHDAPAISAVKEIEISSVVLAEQLKASSLRSGVPAESHSLLSVPHCLIIFAAAPSWTASHLIEAVLLCVCIFLTVLCLIMRSRVRQQDETILLQLREAASLKQSSEERNRAKSEFLENVIHEVRAPMAGVIGMTQLALDTSLSVEQREYLLLVNSSADALLTVVNNILDFSKMEAGELELENIGFTLTDTLVGALRSICMNAHEKGLELVYEIDPEVPARLVGDPGRLRQVLLTLVGNVIRFTGQGEVGLRVHLEKRTDRSILLQFSVYQSNSAADPNQPQTDSTTDKLIVPNSGGSGLGLSFSKQLIGLMGGRFWSESGVGRHAILHFTGDFGICEPPGETRTLEGLTGAQCQVLIVDDNATSRRIMENLLSRMDIRYRSTPSGTVALRMLQEQSFQMVLLDLQMPEVDGFEVATKIRQRWPSEELKIILLTSMGVRGDARHCRELSIDAYLVKPIDTFELAQTISQVLASKLDQETGQAPELITRHSLKEGKFPQLSVERLSVLVAEDNRVNQALARGLLEKQGHKVTIATNGQEAIQAFENEVFDLILMDVQMPVMDGFEATRSIRLLEGSSRRTPIIALTAHAMSSDEERCLAAGMDAFLSKPIHLRELLSALTDFRMKPGDVPVLTPQ